MMKDEEAGGGVLQEGWKDFSERCTKICISLHALGSLSRQTFCSLLSLSLIFLGAQYYLANHRASRKYALPASDHVIASMKENINARVEYATQTPRCFIPYFEPFDASTVLFLDFVEPIICSKVTPLTAVQRLGNEEDVFELQIHESLIPLYVEYGRELFCCYSNIIRLPAPQNETVTLDTDDRYDVSPCVHFDRPVKLKPSEEFLLVKCFSSQANKSDTKLVYSNTHSAFQKKHTVEERIEIKNSSNRLNVLVLCYDSMSRQNFNRTMKKTNDFLRSLGFLEFRAFSKVGTDTFSNAFALLTGLTVPQEIGTYWRKSRELQDSVNIIDGSPFVWKDFGSRGYVTAYLDDGPTMRARDLHATFVEQPTDYYIRPYILASEEHLRIKKKFNSTVCTGPVSVTDRVLEYLTDLVANVRSRNLFSVTWLGNFNREAMNLPRTMDDRTVQFFRDLGLYNVLNDTVVFFLSSRGVWDSRVQNPVQGWYEERMPFLFVWVPPWFERVYPERHRNLQKNALRLVSTYDLHATFRDLLDTPHTPGACPKCSSLFQHVDDDRSCADAGIPKDFCTCTTFVDSPLDRHVVDKAAGFVVQQLRLKIDLHIRRNICADLVLRRVIRSFVSDKEASFAGLYKITFETDPGGGVFQATVYHNRAYHHFVLIGAIERINVLAASHACLKDAVLRPFCHCIKS